MEDRRVNTPHQPVAQQNVESTIIAAHTFIKGELHLSGPTVIIGRVEGAVISESQLEIAHDAVIEGDINAVLVDINGTVKGNVYASRACRLGATARVAGELRAANLAISEGACFVGQVYVGGVASEETEQPAETIPVSIAENPMPNRIESLAEEVEQIAAAAGSANMPSQSPTVRVNAQTVQQTLHRAPKIIKARS
jgi:cytoskeletal protein CcmA (bactofilin family)